MLFRTCLGALALSALSFAPSAAQEDYREINITVGSEVGWLPSEELETLARETVVQFFLNRDSGRYDLAYDMQAPSMKDRVTREEYTAAHSGQDDERGRLIERKLTKVTWTKDSPSQPMPGTYVAVDFEGRYENVQRYCGYLILHRAPGSEAFAIVRTQEVFMSDAVFQEMSKLGGRKAAAAVWSDTATNCPNYVGVF